MKLIRNAVAYGELVKLGHTLFALPFALSALCLAYMDGHRMGATKFVWIVLAFAAARSAAMGFNRVADVGFDALNPRTMNRPTVTGEISIFYATLFTAISALLFLLFAWLINDLCFVLAFPALAVLFGYSYAKRFTWAAHYILGVALALAPIGAWIAAAGTLNFGVLALGAALFFHISGFDLIYALQDREFDIAHKLHSVPSRFGESATMRLAEVSFAAAVAMLALTGLLFKLNAFYYICAAIIALLYIAGLLTIRSCGMRRVNLVFFYLNLSISALILVGTAANLI